MDKEIEVTRDLALAEQEFDELVIELENEEDGSDDSENKEEEKRVDSTTDEEEKEEKPKKKNNYQSRINQLTWQAREAERQKEELAQRAALMEEKLNQLEEKYSSTSNNILEEKENSLKAARRKALEDSDFDNFEQIDSELAEVRIQRKTKPVERTQATNVQTEQTRVPTPNDMFAAEWLQNNDWWGQDEGKTQHAMTVDNELKSEGYNPNTPSFWRELDNRIDQFDHGRQDSNTERRRSQQIVDGPSNRPNRKKTSFSLSPQEQAYARELGIIKGGPGWDRYVQEVKNQRKGQQNA